MPSPTKSTDLAAVHARLHATLADLQSQRAALIASFPSATPTKTNNTTTSSKSTPEPPSSTTTSATPPTPPPPTSISIPPAPTPSPSLLSPSPTSHDQAQQQQQQQFIITSAHAILKRHIRLLHAYNGIRDIGQGLLGLIADQRGVRLVDVMEEFGADVGD